MKAEALLTLSFPLWNRSGVDRVISTIPCYLIEVGHFEITELLGLFQPLQSQGVIPNKETEAGHGEGVLLQLTTQRNSYPQGTRV